MNFQEKLDQTNLDMTLPQVKAFFLGAMLADKPMSFSKALEEMLSEAPDAMSLKADFENIWNDLEKNKAIELANLFPEVRDNRSFLAVAKDQLDYFLTALALAGTNIENCKDETVSDVLDELEDFVFDLDDYLAEDDDSVEGDDLKDMLKDIWNEYLIAKGFKQ
jgi:hypothetical protein